MNQARHVVGGLIIFAVIIGLFTTVYNEGLEKQYDIVRTNITINGSSTSINIVEKMNNLQIIKGISNITSAFKPDEAGNKVDLLGMIALSGLGSLKIIYGMFTIPFEISGIVSDYLNIPPIILSGILALFVVYLVFILISAKLGKDI